MPNLVDEILGAAKAGESLSEEYVAELAAGIILAQVHGAEITETLPAFSKSYRNVYFRTLSEAYLREAHSYLSGTSWARSKRLSVIVKKYTLQRDPVWGNNTFPENNPIYACLHQAMQFGWELPQSASRINEIVMETIEFNNEMTGE